MKTSPPSKTAAPEAREPQASPAQARLEWRRPTLRKIDALDAQMAKGRAPHDYIHLS